MIRKFYKNYKELSKYMIDKAQDGYYTVAVLFYNDALCLLRELACCNDVEIEALDIKPKEYDGYDKEYYVSIADDMVLSVEPAYVCDKYLRAEADLTLIDGNANSAIIKNLPKDMCREIYIGFSEDEIEDCGLEYDCNEEEKKLDDFFEDVEFLKSNNGRIIGIRTDVNSLFRFLFG